MGSLVNFMKQFTLFPLDHLLFSHNYSGEIQFERD